MEPIRKEKEEQLEHSAPETQRDPLLEFQKRVMRPMGALLLASAMVLAKFFVWDLLESVKTGEQNVTYSVKLILLIGVLPTLGAMMLLMGPKAVNVLKAFQEPQMNWTQILVLTVLVVPAILLLLWVKTHLSVYGYSVQ